MAHFFIDRPIFAWVIAIIIMLAGLFVEVARCLNQDIGPKSGGKGVAEPVRGWAPT